MEPTLLMLDEPTNHLDLNAVIWLNKCAARGLPLCLFPCPHPIIYFLDSSSLAL